MMIEHIRLRTTIPKNLSVGKKCKFAIKYLMKCTFINLYNFKRVSKQLFETDNLIKEQRLKYFI